jgi:hypothetical protein
MNPTSIFKSISGVAGNAAGALSSGAAGGIEDALKKEVCKILQADKDEITESAIKAIDDKIKESSDTLLAPVIETIKEIIKTEVTNQLAEDKENEKISRGNAQPGTIPTQDGLPSVEPSTSENRLLEEEIEPTNSIEETPIIENKPEETPIIEKKPEETPIIENKSEETPIIENKPEETPIIENKPLEQSVSDQATKIKDEALKTATNEANKLKERAMDELKKKAAEKLGPFGNFVTGLAPGIIKTGGTKKQRTKPIKTKNRSKRVKYGSGNKTAYSKKGGRRSTKRLRK